MSQMDIEEILKEWPEEWRNPVDSSSNSEDITHRHTDKGKNKQVEGKSTENHPEAKKRPALQSEATPHARKKRKAIRRPYEPKLSTKDCEHITTSVQETMKESMTVIVTLQQAMQMVLDNKMVELKTLLQRAHQVQPTQSSTGTP
jgi:hypothetical protein